MLNTKFEWTEKGDYYEEEEKLRIYVYNNTLNKAVCWLGK